MIILIAFSFLAGVVTILSPCILPILPIILSSSITGGKRKPLGVVSGFILSFTFFTLFLATLVNLLGISASALRLVSVFIIIAFGFSLLLPQFQALLEQLFAKLSRFTPNSQNKTGFLGGFIIGLSIGIIWTPCVGPILASVISLAITGTITSSAVFITFAYSLGTAIPMLAIVYGGRELLNKVPGLMSSTGRIQKAFGIIMILTGFAIFFNYDRAFQAYVIEKFPSYGIGLTQLEENQAVQKQLNSLQAPPGAVDSSDMGKPMFEILKEEGTAPEIVPGGKWFNSEPLTLSQLRGKVVLVDFWTYTCINCIRTLPYLRDWHAKYADQGLVIIGVHTPEFEFEKDANNLQKAITDFDLQYAIVQDNNYATWRAYRNRYWPAKYLIDKDGVVRYHHFGEGDYDETEEAIQALLKESGSEITAEVSNPDYQIDSRTPELYLGSSRMSRLTSKSTTQPPLNYFSFLGDWETKPEYSQPAAGSKLALHFESKNVFLVMRTQDGSEAQVKISLFDESGNPVSPGGKDLQDDNTATVQTDRLYSLVELDSPGKFFLELEFIDPNIQVFAFTFG